MSEQGECPKCGALNLDYGERTDEGDAIVYPYRCCDCGFKGQEAYALDFVGHLDEDGKPV